MTDEQVNNFLSSVDVLMEEVNEVSFEKGDWDAHYPGPNPLEKLALIHSSVSSVVEGEAMGLGVEYVGRALAEVVIRVMDYAYFYNYDLPRAIDEMRKELLEKGG
jgi:NTP pyrophosphatase (non-canonical NTP hydrolase)